MKSPAKSAARLSDLPVRTSEQLKAPFRSSEPASETCGSSERLAAELLDAAFAAAGLSNKDIAHLCGVSQSLVEKWRSTESRGAPSFVQLLLLPPAFHITLHKLLNRRFGFSRAALRDLLEAAGSLALLVD